MRKKGLLLLIVFLLTVPPWVVIAESNTVIIHTEIVNVRSGPGLSYSVVAKVQKGEEFPILETKGDWIKVKISATKMGWIANWLVSTKLTSGLSSTGQSSTGFVNTDGLRIRKGPGTNFPIVGFLENKTKVDVFEKKETWLHIKNGQIDGWVSSNYITQTKATTKSTEKEQTRPADTQLKAKWTVSVTADAVNVRSMPSTDSAVIGKLNTKDTVEAVSEKNGWTEISYKGSTAWISSQFVKKSSSSGATSETISPNSPSYKIKITVDSLNVRSLASLDGKVTATVAKGQSYSVSEEKNNWIKIEYSPKKFGWISSWYTEKVIEAGGNPPAKDQPVANGNQVIILFDGTNLRDGATVNSKSIARANKGTTYRVKAIKGQWYEVYLKGNQTAYVAGWLVSVKGNIPQIIKPGAEKYLQNKTIVLDPGHGGGDVGAIGAKGTFEKDITLRSTLLLADKLKAAGAKVILTRSKDTYVSLNSRVATSHIQAADAFISLHYDSSYERTARGITTYYYHDYQKGLASSLQTYLMESTNFNNKGSRFGDYQVVRENKRVATLIELGYLSNPTEEANIVTNQYQESATNGIFNGLASYFK